MTKQQASKKRQSVKHQFAFLIVSIVLGFLFSYAYNTAKTKDNTMIEINSSDFERKEQLRENLIVQQERNKELEEEKLQLQQKIKDYEQDFSGSKEGSRNLVKQADNLRLMLGKIPGQGSGVTVTLQDAEYNPKSVNPNDYIVHESHVFKVLNELKISGAQAIAINGHRLEANSYIKCNGPVITIDDDQFPAPFIIEAVGDPKVLSAGLTLAGGVYDQLIDDNIVVVIDSSKELIMPAVQGNS
ncbi:DUF881 domain-containing protein [Viridibacillus sp. YIM B01967]|uniref:DUF881 domain-containing protein n=1 Tax=Viridibacillus soli TaxID=2798301 RepID=A0ABS1H5Q3_9BACL|nr:DUF881 domain-containing protein [Viridibacillus soli]MBK3494487.1 DUF881 domain-containing protein [Viridibacillus soli]